MLIEFATGGLASLVGGDPVLAQYGAGDIATDLVFDAAGGAVVAAWSTDRLDDVRYPKNSPSRRYRSTYACRPGSIPVRTR